MKRLFRSPSDLLLAIFVLAVVLLLAFKAFAREGGQWFNTGPIKEWFQTLMQPDNPGSSCCGEADAFESDVFDEEDGHYVAIITDGKGMIPNGKRINIPNAKIKWDKGNPTGHGWVFIGSAGQVYCYVTPGGI